MGRSLLVGLPTKTRILTTAGYVLQRGRASADRHLVFFAGRFMAGFGCLDGALWWTEMEMFTTSPEMATGMAHVILASPSLSLARAPECRFSIGFTPETWSSLNAGDTDLGSSGPILIPGTDLLLGGGKASIFYLMHTSSSATSSPAYGQMSSRLPIMVARSKVARLLERSGGVGPWMYVWSNGCDYLNLSFYASD